MKFIYTILLFLGFTFILQAQDTGHDIRISLKNYHSEFVTVGYYFGDRQLVLDTVYKKDDQFSLQGDTLLQEGMYLLLLNPDNKFIQFTVNSYDQKFNVVLDSLTLNQPIFEGSEDNKLFYDYISFIGEKGQISATLNQQYSEKQAAGESTDDITKQIDELNQEVKNYQLDLVENHPNTVTSKVIKSTFEIEIPDFEGNQDEIQNKQYYYYKSHFFDHVDLADPTSLFLPFLHNKIETYTNNLTPQIPDSINYALDYLLGQMEPVKRTYQFYLSTFLNKYANSKVVGFDAIYVHLVDNFYAKGKAPWVDAENLQKIVEQANKIRPTLIGNKAQDIQVYKRDGSAISFKDITNKYLILYFWAPDCGHCSKSTPHVIDYYKKVKDSIDIEILAVCTKHRDKEKTCWEGVDEKGMDLWINASDINHTSGFRFKYNVETTPQIYILNEDRQIVMKRIGAEKLDEVMQEIIRMDDLKAMEEQMGKE